MPQPEKRTRADRVLVDLVEADVDIGFSLVDVATTEFCRGNPASGERALREAEAIVTDIEQRLLRLDSSGSAPFRQLVTELRREIDAARPKTS